MAKPVTIPNTFATATTSIPLANLDADFSTVATALNDASTYSNYALDSGTTNAYVVSLSGLSTTYQAGLAIQFQATSANTGPCTLNVNGQGAKNIIYPDGSTLSANAIVVGAIASVMYDGSSFQLLSVKNAAGGGGGGGSVSSVAMTVPAFLSVAGTPITTSGTLAVSYSGTPLPIANGGTGATTAAGIRVTIGAGDVNGPAASVDDEIALYSSTTGKVIKRATTTGILKQRLAYCRLLLEALIILFLAAHLAHHLLAIYQTVLTFLLEVLPDSVLAYLLPYKPLLEQAVHLFLQAVQVPPAHGILIFLVTLGL